MKRLEKIIWIMVTIYTLMRILSGDYSVIAFVSAIILLRIIIWRISLK